MKPRQYKKLCKKAMEILVAGGSKAEHFSQEEDSLVHEGRTHWFMCWGLNTGPDYYGECDWYDAWFLLCQQVIDSTADFESCTGSDDDNPYHTSIRGTINTLRHGRVMYGLA
ncbi:hypothetical protein [Endozoicomonas sp. ALC066]|uniref:hypothetical protein n=1 Tax=Endozoicomonas sp. ALC066 TaxID=3403078 RepID=UPI003BB52950